MVLRPDRPRHPAHQLRREMNQLFSGFLANPERFWPIAGQGQPAVNVWDSTDAIHVEMEVPGVKSDQVEISVAGDELTVKIERPELKQGNVVYHRRERPVGSFARVLRLPTEVDADQVEAELRHGVLTIRLPKAEAARPRKIQVKAAS
jgi:HSP20 family protein